MKNLSQNKYAWIALAVVTAGTFMASLDSSIVNVAVPKMMAVFGVSTGLVQWIVTGYMLTLGIVIPLTGYLSDRFGMKTVFVIAISIFTAGSAFCSVAWSFGAMIAARVIQALGGGMIIPVGMTMLLKIFPVEKRGLALGIWGISLMSAPAAGPVISGYLIQYVNWRVIFTINIPIGIAVVLVGALLLKESQKVTENKLDIPGAVTSCIGLFSLLLALSKGSSLGWNSTIVICLFAISIVTLGAFVLIELKSGHPLIDLRVLKSLPYSAGLTVSAISTVAMYGIVFFTPIYYQALKGYTAMHTGMMMVVPAMVSALMMPIGGKIFDKFGAKGITVWGLAASAASFFLLGKFMSLDTTDAVMILISSLSASGMGLSMMPIQTAAMSAVPKESVSRASALLRTTLQISASLGIAILTTVMQGRVSSHAAEALKALNISTEQIHNLQENLQGALNQSAAASSSASIPPQVLTDLVKAAYVRALDDTFLVTMGIMAVGIMLALLLPGKRKKQVTQDK